MPRGFWLTSFMLSNVLIDLEVLYYIHRGESPLHRHLHTYVGGVAMGVVAALVMLSLALVARAFIPAFSRRLGISTPTPIRLMLLQSLAAGLVGGVSHIVLDSFMHRDMHPFWPFARGNSLIGLVGIAELHIALALMGFLGIVIWLFLRDTE